MSEQNVEIARRSFTALTRGSVDSAAEFWHPEISWRAVQHAPDDVGEMHGIEAARRYVQDWFDTFEDFESVPEELLDVGSDLVIAVVRISGRARSSGVPTEQRYASVSTIRDGKVVRVREYSTKEEALEAVGLQEEVVSRESVTVVRRGVALLNEARWDELFDLCDPQVEFCDLRSAVDTPQVLKGSGSVKALLIAWSDAWEDFGSEVYEYVDADPFVICDTRWYGTGRESGAAIDVRQSDVYEVRNGRLIRVTLGYANKDEALKAVGVET